MAVTGDSASVIFMQPILLQKLSSLQKLLRHMYRFGPYSNN